MRYFALPAAVLLAACAADTFATNDGGSDAGGSPDAPLADAPKCAPVAMSCPANAICTSFDDGTTDQFKNSSLQPSTADVLSDKYVSCPNALKATVQIGNAGPVRAGISYDANIPATLAAHATLDAEVWLPSVIGSQMAFMTVRAGADPLNVVRLESQSDGTWHFVVHASGQDKTIQPLTGGWNHFTMAVDFSTSSGSNNAQLTYTDSNNTQQTATIGDPTLTGATTAFSGLGADLGVAGQGNDSPITAWFDDVSFAPTLL